MQISNDVLIFGGAAGCTLTMDQNSMDFNSVTVPGIYNVYVSGADLITYNAPWAGWSFLLVFNIDNAAIKQIAFDPWADIIKQRRCSYGTWSSWTQLH